MTSFPYIFRYTYLFYLLAIHEDVDAAFSQIAKTLRQQDVETFDDLVSILPNGKHLGLMYDGKGWMYPHLVDPQHHTQPLHYRFQAINDKDVKVHYKGLFNQSHGRNMNLGFLNRT